MSFRGIKDLLYSYFPDTKLEDEALITQQIDDGEILFKPERILSYLQTVFFEEHLLELQLDQLTEIERMAASVQRLQLREISEKTAKLSGVCLMKELAVSQLLRSSG